MKKHFLKWMIVGTLTIFTAVSLVGCSIVGNNDRKRATKKENDVIASSEDKDVAKKKANPEQNDKKEEERGNEKKEYIAESDLDAFFLDPDQFEGKYIKLAGQVQSELEKGDDQYYLRAYYDIENFEKEFNVRLDKAQKINTEDIFIIEGKIEGATGTLEDIYLSEDIPLISTESIKISSYMEAYAPAQKAVEPQTPVDQYGFVVSIDKIEFATRETRVYVTATNNSSTPCSIYGFNSKIVQNGQQFETSTPSYYGDYAELPSEILSGVSASGILVFPPVDSEKELDITLEGNSGNWEEEFSPYTYKITP